MRGEQMSDQYFAAKEANKAASDILEKANSWYNELHTNGYLDKIRQTWMAYHGAHNADFNNSHKITFGGEQGELTFLAVNHFRNIAQHILRMITSNRPAFQARATNIDNKSLIQAKLANQLLDYYMREKRLETVLQRAVEYSIALGTGYVKMEWNATSGEIFDVNEDTGTPIYEGDVEFKNMSPYDVVFDATREDQNHDWVVCRTFKNKYDLAAKYPEMESKILKLQTKSELLKFRLENNLFNESSDVAVYEFFHRKSESLPNGRYLLFLGEDIVLYDGDLPYRNLPIYRISPSDVLGTPYGYTPMFDLLPLQEAVNSLYSILLTNQIAFGVQNIYVPRGAEISLKSLEGGLNIIEGNPQAGKPEPINFTQSPAEVFRLIDMLKSEMETISGVNSVARGNPEASLKSGTALALVQSMALQFISGLQQQYVQLVEDVGTGLISMLRDFAQVPRIAMIAGKANQSYIAEEFSGDDLSQVNRVVVDLANPISKTTAGKMEMASQLIQYGIIKSPEQYISILTTGNMDTMTDDVQNELLLIRDENERLAAGQKPTALAIDEHLKHIKSHRSILNTHNMRQDTELSNLVLEHINEHLELLRSTDPALLQLIGEQPLGPAAGTPAAQPAPNDLINESQAPSENGPMAPVAGPEQAPGMPSMPQVDPNALPNPELQQQAMGNVNGQ